MVEVYTPIQIAIIYRQNHWYLNQFSIFLSADLAIRFVSVRALKWAIYRFLIPNISRVDQKFSEIHDEIIILYKNLIHFLNNIDFAENFDQLHQY